MDSRKFAADPLSLALQINAKTNQIKETTKKLEDQLSQNMKLINQFKFAEPHTSSIVKELEERKKILEEKRKTLASTQAELINSIQNPLEIEKPQEIPPSIAALPVVMSNVLKFVTNLTETAVDQPTVTIPILSLFKTNQLLNQLYTTLAKKEIIHEDTVEYEERMHSFLESQAAIVNGLKAVEEALSEEEEKQETTQSDQPQEAELPTNKENKVEQQPIIEEPEDTPN